MDLTRIKVEDIKQEITPWKTPGGVEVRKITIVTELHGKPKFYSHKKDSDEETVAYQGFKSGKITKGVEVNVMINEGDEQTFTNKAGKVITFRPKWLSFFEGISALPEAGEQTTVEDRMDDAAGGEIKDEVPVGDIPF